MIWLQVPSNALGMAARVTVSLYLSFALGMLFLDLRRRREGADLEAAIAELASAPPAGGGRA